MFYFTVSLRKNGFSAKKDILPHIDILPLTRFKFPTNICRNELLPECFFPKRTSLSPGSMATYYVM